VQADRNTFAKSPFDSPKSKELGGNLAGEIKRFEKLAMLAREELKTRWPAGDRPDFGWEGQGFSPEVPEEFQRAALASYLAAEFWSQKAAAWTLAGQRGWPVRGTGFELMSVDENGDPVYVGTTNVNARTSTAVSLVQNVAPFNTGGALSGSGLRVGVWDEGGIRSTHQEFGARVTTLDGSGLSDHGTHVGGTIGAAGTVASALAGC
jgi:hypothetical protein